jgi:bisphosphoglycerate-dependent phosphoglycerate mutase
LKIWEKHWSEQVAKLAVWLSGLVTFAQAEQILREVGQINMSQSSVWRRVERWGGRLQAVEAFQQAKAYGFEEPEAIDPNRS